MPKVSYVIYDDEQGSVEVPEGEIFQKFLLATRQTKKS